LSICTTSVTKTCPIPVRNFIGGRATTKTRDDSNREERKEGEKRGVSTRPIRKGL